MFLYSHVETAKIISARSVKKLIEAQLLHPHQPVLLEQRNSQANLQKSLITTLFIIFLMLIVTCSPASDFDISGDLINSRHFKEYIQGKVNFKLLTNLHNSARGG